MSRKLASLMRNNLPAIATVAVVLPAVAGIALAAQDRYTVKVPNGLAFSEFRGYEKWQVVAISHGDELMEAILGNQATIDAFAAGVPGNGQHFPDGSKMAKFHWTMKKSPDGFPAMVPDTLHDIDFMAKDSKRFSDSGGWGYAQFNYDNKSDTFAPLGTGAKCGYACHTAAASKDYVFTAFPKR